ncbi:sulfotransferase [Candidatus Parcubacteria bacterium]|nr:MAG: sulfotransferase [Candidatus Parcubacteria bacterium]
MGCHDLSNPDQRIVKTYFFISGLPRSGSTLLCNILNQNPEIYASATSGLSRLFVQIHNSWMDIPEIRAMPSAEREVRLKSTLRGLFDGFYASVNKPYIFDKSRLWPRYIEWLEDVFEAPVKFLVTVRDLREVLASMEALYRKRKWPLPGEREHPVAFQTIAGRCAFWMRDDQLVGSAYRAIQDALQRGYGDRLHFVDYERLTREPEETLQSVYDFLGLQSFAHDFEHVEQATQEDDSVYGYADLHTIRPRVEPQEPKWPELLGEVAYQYAGMNLW